MASSTVVSGFIGHTPGFKKKLGLRCQVQKFIAAGFSLLASGRSPSIISQQPVASGQEPVVFF
jgi:hypothetical protein